MIVVDPRGHTIERWSALTAASLSQYGQVPQFTDEAGWREWGRAILSLPAVAALLVPDPEMFGTWQEWAARLNAQIANL